MTKPFTRRDKIMRSSALAVLSKMKATNGVRPQPEPEGGSQVNTRVSTRVLFVSTLRNLSCSGLSKGTVTGPFKGRDCLSSSPYDAPSPFTTVVSTSTPLPFTSPTPTACSSVTINGTMFVITGSMNVRAGL
jgi:hypothetical protein